MAPHLKEELVLQAAYSFEQNTDYGKQKPSMV
jgi:hypothetical protein